MNGKVLVVCASRDRNSALARMLDSLDATSTKADAAIYIDEDQTELYAELLDEVGIKWLIGPQVGPVQALNQLVEKFPGYEAYGAATDDSTFESKGWDEWVLKTTANFKNQIGVMAPNLRGSKRMDFPWATAKWIEVTGWLAFPSAYHFYWDIMSELLGEATQIAYATYEEFGMLHDDAPTPDINVKSITDARNVLPAIALERPKLIEKLRAAIG